MYDLIGVRDRKENTHTSNFLVGPVGLPPGLTENQYINNLITATDFYNANTVNYDVLPEALPGEGYNSGGFASGLAGATGGTLPDISNTGFGVPGVATPVPPGNFGVGPLPQPSSGGFLQGIGNFFGGVGDFFSGLGNFFAGIGNFFGGLFGDLGGGYVVYPNQPNYNTSQRAYQK